MSQFPGWSLQGRRHYCLGIVTHPGIDLFPYQDGLEQYYILIWYLVKDGASCHNLSSRCVHIIWAHSAWDRKYNVRLWYLLDCWASLQPVVPVHNHSYYSVLHPWWQLWPSWELVDSIPLHSVISGGDVHESPASRKSTSYGNPGGEVLQRAVPTSAAPTGRPTARQRNSGTPEGGLCSVLEQWRESTRQGCREGTKSTTRGEWRMCGW